MREDTVADERRNVRKAQSTRIRKHRKMKSSVRLHERLSSHNRASPAFTILVTGAGGQLGRELALLQPPGVRIVGLDRQALDVTDYDACLAAVEQSGADAVIHAAAYTAVDRAESEPDVAYRVNVIGTQNISRAAEAFDAKLVYVSTDYVFDGMGSRPYRENDPPAPRTVYGLTKLEGEQAARSLCSRSFVVRTSWVYGAHGPNFVRTMLDLARSGRELAVVDDQRGAPTYTLDLARVLVRLAWTFRYGVYHASNGGSCTWYQFARAIFEESGLEVALRPCTTADYPRPAPRPAYSVLAHHALRRAGLPPMRHWRDALRDFLAASLSRE